MLSHQNLDEGLLVLSNKKVQKEKCLKLFFVIPVWDEQYNNIEQTVSEMLNPENKEVALGNVTYEHKIKGFPAIYMQNCFMIEGYPLIHKGLPPN